jgi:hypothetical protein
MLLSPHVDHVTHPHMHAEGVLADLLEGSCHAVETTGRHKIRSTDRFLGKKCQTSKQSELNDWPLTDPPPVPSKHIE